MITKNQNFGKSRAQFSRLKNARLLEDNGRNYIVQCETSDPACFKAIRFPKKCVRLMITGMYISKWIIAEREKEMGIEIFTDGKHANAS